MFARGEERADRSTQRPPRKVSGSPVLPFVRAGTVLPTQLIALQQTAGNRATCAHLAVQRCGDVGSDDCGCHSDETDTDSDHRRASTQRQVKILPFDPKLLEPIPGGTDDESTFCKPYSTKAKALRRRDELLINAVVPLRAAFGAAVGTLWGQYLFGGRPPQEITNKEVIESFATDPVTLAARPAIMRRAFDALAAKPDIEDGRHQMEELVPVGSQADLEAKFNWSNPFSKPGNIAGGLGKDQVSTPIGATPSPVNDARAVRGSIIVATDADGKRTATVKPVISVDDTIDLCPGDAGSILEQNLTNPLSKCEASGVSGDIPYHLNFSMPAETRSIAPLKPDPPPPPKPVTIPSSVLFEFGSAVVTPAGETQLMLVLGDRPQRADLSQGIKVSGHTDSKGPEDFNMRLSLDRARAVAVVLERRFPQFKGALKVDGRGELEPVAPNEIAGKDNPEGRRLNRRVVVELASMP